MFGRVRVVGLAVLVFLLAMVMAPIATAQIVATTPTTKIGTGTLITPTAAAAYYASLGAANTTSTNEFYASTPPKEIVELSRALKGDPDLIFEYVRNNSEIVWTFGLQKGPLGVIVDRSGTAFDQAALMVSLIRAAGGTANYQYGTITLTGAQWQLWSGLTSAAATTQLLANGGIPAVVSGTTTVTSVTLAHVWVQVVTAGGTFVLDPAYKAHTFKTGTTLATAAGFTTGTPMTQAGTTMVSGSNAGVSFISTLSSTQLATTLQTTATTLQTWIDANVSDGEVEDVVGGAKITPATAAQSAHSANLPYTSAVSATWTAATGGVPNAYRTLMTVQASRKTGNNSDLPLFNRPLYVDDIYGRKLVVLSRNGGKGGTGTDTLQMVDEMGTATLLASGPPSGDGPALNDATISLLINHPYASKDTPTSLDGTYMDTTVVKHAMMWMPLVIVHSWGDVDPRIVDKWGARADSEAPLVDSPGCETCNVYSPSAGDGRREQLAAAWMAQSSRAARLHASIAQSTYAHHHSVGVVAADTEINTIDNDPNHPGIDLDYAIRDSFDRLDIDTAFSLTSTTANATDRRAAVHAIAETVEALEGSVAAQVSDLPDTVSTATRFDWGNKPPLGVNEDDAGAGVSRKVYEYTDATKAAQAQNLMKFEGAASATGTGLHTKTVPTFNSSESGAWESAVSAAIVAYVGQNFTVVASEESFLGPGQRAGAFVPQPGGTTYLHLPTHQRGGALIATKYAAGEPIEIAHIAVGLRDRAKGGGGGAQADHQARYDPSKAADVLKAKFVDRSSAVGVDLQRGGVTYTSPASLSVGQGDFPYKLDAQVIWRGGDAVYDTFSPQQHTSPQAPWTTNWHNTLTMSGSGLEAMGVTDVRTSASAIAAFMALQDVYKSAPSAQREVTATLVGAWWVKQLSGNVVTVNVGAGTQQFIRRAAGDWISPGPGEYASLAQTGARTVFTPNCGASGYVQTRGYDYSGLSFDVTRSGADVQHFGYWTKRISNGSSYCQDFHGFRMTTWTFPQNVIVTVNYTASAGLDVISEVHNNLGRQINFTNGGIAPASFAGGFTNNLAGADARTVTISSDGLTHTDPNNKVTTFVVSTVGGYSVNGFSGGGQRYRLNFVKTADDATNPALSYTYDYFNRAMTGKDRLAYLGQRPAHEFYLAEGLRGERKDPAGQSYVVYYDLEKHPIQFVDEASNITKLGYDGRGRVVSYTYPEGNREAYTYTEANNVAIATRTTRTGYPNGTSTYKAGWHATFHKPNYITDPRGIRTDFTYWSSGNGKGQIASATRPAPVTGGTRPVWNFTYNTYGQPLTVTDPMGVVTQNTYDTANYLWKTALSPTGINAVTTFTNNPLGDPTSIDGPRSDVVDITSIGYDPLRRKTLEVAPDTGNGQPFATQTTYDAIGRVTLQAEGYYSGAFTSLRNVATTYDVVGNKTAEVQSAGGTAFAASNYAYDNLNRVTCSAVRMNPATFTAGIEGCSLGAEGPQGPDRITHTSYDPLGQPTQVEIGYRTALAATFASFGYSPNGLKLSVTDANNNKTTYDYDGLSRLAKVSFPQSTPRGSGLSSTTDYEAYTYDNTGNRLTLRKRSGVTITYGYDNIDRLTSKVLPAPYDTASVYIDYDLADRPTFRHLATTTGVGIGYGYDTAGRQTTETSYGRTVTSGYDIAGNRNRVTWPDTAFYVDYTYDAANRLKQVRETGATSGLGLLASLTYGPLNQRATLARGNNTSAAYSYDTTGRLTGLTQGALPVANSSVQTMTYNPASQVVHLTQAGNNYVWTGHPVTTINFAHDGLNRDGAIAALSNGFDTNGNLANDGTRSFTYDVLNRLTAETGGSAPLSIAYDPADRIYKTTSGTNITEFLYDGDRLIAEYDSGTGLLQRRYVHGVETDEPLVWYDGQTTTPKRWLHADRQGSIIAWSDTAGTPHYYTYGPYGEPQDWAGSRFRYTGQIALPEAQLYHYKARVYDPVMGRFLQTDLLGQQDDPNLYAYVGSDPTNHSDPTGLETFDCTQASTCPSQMTLNDLKKGDVIKTAGATITIGAKDRGSVTLGLSINREHSDGSSAANKGPILIPPSPKGVSTSTNMAQGKQHGGDPLWYFNQVRNHGPMDYKQQGKVFEPYGNFNFGAVGRANNSFNAQSILQGAGWAQTRSGTSRSGWGSPGAFPLPFGAVAPFGDDPSDQYWITQGMRYYDATNR